MADHVKDDKATFSVKLEQKVCEGANVTQTRDFTTEKDDLDNGKVLVEGKVVHVNKVFFFLF